MTDKDEAMPTPGPWNYEVFTARELHEPECYAHIWAKVEPSAVASCEGWDGRDVEPDAALIAAGGTAAHEVRQMGYDPVKAVEALPRLIEALKYLSIAAQTTGGTAGPDEGLQIEINRAAKALTRAAGEKVESHE